MRIADMPQTDEREASHRHLVRLYEADAALLDELQESIPAALLAGDVQVLVATPEHRGAIEQVLIRRGFDLVDLAVCDRYVALDARATLLDLRIGEPGDEERFDAIIGGLIRRVTRSGRTVHAFGEMVALLLADGDPDGAIRLERLWNGLLEEPTFDLLCAYPLDAFKDDRLSVAFRDICFAHAAITTDERGDDRDGPANEVAQRGHLTLVSEAREETERALPQRDAFLSAAAHELRTPLTGILGYVQLMLRRGEHIEPRDAHRVLNRIAGQAQRMRSLIDQLLDASQPDSGLHLVYDEVDLRAALHEIVQYQQAAEITLEGPAVTVSVDRRRIQQVLMNLLDNARKYSEPGSPIEVTIDDVADEGVVAFSVRDHGSGINEDGRARIFERFYRAQGDSHADLGIGLFVTREIVEAHGGQIAMEFPADGGTRFTVTLPVAPPGYVDLTSSESHVAPGRSHAGIRPQRLNRPRLRANQRYPASSH